MTTDAPRDLNDLLLCYAGQLLNESRREAKRASEPLLADTPSSDRAARSAAVLEQEARAILAHLRSIEDETRAVRPLAGSALLADRPVEWWMKKAQAEGDSLIVAGVPSAPDFARTLDFLDGIERMATEQPGRASWWRRLALYLADLTAYAARHAPRDATEREARPSENTHHA